MRAGVLDRLESNLIWLLYYAELTNNSVQILLAYVSPALILLL